MKRVLKLTFSTILAALLLSACTQPPAPVSAPPVANPAPEAPSSQEEPVERPVTEPEEEPGLVEQLDAIYAQLDASPIPQLEEALWDHFVDLSAGTPDALPPQIIRDEPKSYEVAQLIRSLLYPDDNPQSFASIDDAYRPALLQTAIYHTAPLDLNWNWDSSTQTFSVDRYHDHVVTALLKHELAEGRSVSAVFSGESVRATMRRLYGDVDFFEMDVPPYYYYAREDMFVQMGDWGGPMWRYPQITAYQETENGIVCEAVLIWALDKNTPLEENGTVLTSANFESATASCPKFRYTFTRAADDDRLILSGYEILRKGAE